MGSYITIPEGKRVRFKRDRDEIDGLKNIMVLLEEDITITMNSSYSSITKGSSPVALSLVSGIIRDAGFKNIAGWVGGQFKQFGFQTWTGTDPLQTSFTVNLVMKNNALEDVVKPALALAKLCLPGEGTGGTLIAPGPSVLSAFEGEDQADEEIESGKPLTCYLGSYVLRNVIVTRAQPTFSKFIDDRGYPISARVELSISTIFSATTNIIDSMLGGD